MERRGLARDGMIPDGRERPGGLMCRERDAMDPFAFNRSRSDRFHPARPSGHRLASGFRCPCPFSSARSVKETSPGERSPPVNSGGAVASGGGAGSARIILAAGRPVRRLLPRPGRERRRDRPALPGRRRGLRGDDGTSTPTRGTSSPLFGSIWPRPRPRLPVPDGQSGGDWPVGVRLRLPASPSPLRKSPPCFVRRAHCGRTIPDLTQRA